MVNCTGAVSFPTEDYDAKVGHIRTEIKHVCVLWRASALSLMRLRARKTRIHHYVPSITSTMYKHSIADYRHQFIIIRLIQSNVASQTIDLATCYMSTSTNKDILISL